MIRKPAADWARDDRGERARAAKAAIGVKFKSIETGYRVLQGRATSAQGYIRIAGGAVWLFFALVGLASGSIPTLVGASAIGGGLVMWGRFEIRRGRAHARKARGIAAVVQQTVAPAVMAARPLSAMQPATAGDDVCTLGHVAASTFDADAIIARHLADRERLAAQAQAVPVPLVQPARPAFGRKVA